MRGGVACAFVALAAANVAAATPDYPWFNTSIPFHHRAQLLVEAMTDAEVFNQTTKEASAIPRLGVPQYSYWAEAAHGVAGAGLATVFPASILRGAAFDVESERVMATMIAQEARAKHAAEVAAQNFSDDLHSITMYAPVVNIVRDGRWGRSQETYGEDPTVAGTLGRAFVEGLQANASAPATKYLYTSAMAKHFVAYNLESDFIAGGNNGNFRLRYDANISTADFLQSYSPQFRSLVSGVNGAATIMCSYNAIGGIPMCAHPLLHSFLRDELQFDGPIFSDGGAVHYIFSEHNYTADLPHAAAVAINAGVDLNSGGKNSDFGFHYLPQAVAANLTNMTRIRQAVTRLMLLRMRLGMFDPDKDVPFAAPPLSVVASAQNVAVARTIAQRGIVLLRNDNNTLPVNGNTPISLAVIGPNADRPSALLSSYAGCREPWDGTITPECNLVTPLQGLKNAVATAGNNNAPVQYVEGCGLNASLPGGIAEAQTAASNASHVVLVLGISTDGAGNDGVLFEGEAHDRTTLALAPAQQALFQAVCDTVVAQSRSRLIVVLMNGGPISSQLIATSECVDALVEAWYPGQEGGNALADIVFGTISPSGRLPVTVPVDDTQLAFDYFNLDLAAAPHGRTYRYYNGSDPLYPFGFGLSYANFTYSKLIAVVDAASSPGRFLNVSVTVTNSNSAGEKKSTGATACADEVVQLYIGLDINSETSRFMGERSIPLLELKKFARIACLRPGASRTIGLSLDVETDLKLVDADGRFGVIGGNYSVWVGGRAPGSIGVGGSKSSLHASSGIPREPLHTTVTIATSVSA